MWCINGDMLGSMVWSNILNFFPASQCQWFSYLDSWAGSPNSLTLFSDLSFHRCSHIQSSECMIVTSLLAGHKWSLWKAPWFWSFQRSCQLLRILIKKMAEKAWLLNPQLVPADELGKVFGTVAVCGDLANIAGTLLANSLYSPLRLFNIIHIISTSSHKKYDWNTASANAVYFQQ